MKLELALLDFDPNKLSNSKNSLFRIQVVDQAKALFEVFFDAEKRAQETTDSEKKAIFEEKLFGNMEFVGELYRRKMVGATTLIEIFL